MKVNIWFYPPHQDWPAFDQHKDNYITVDKWPFTVLPNIGDRFHLYTFIDKKTHQDLYEIADYYCWYVDRLEWHKECVDIILGCER